MARDARRREWAEALDLDARGGALNHAAHIRVKARNSDGHVCGEHHHRAKYTDAQVLQVFALNDQGLGRRKIAFLLKIPVDTVRRWLDCTRRSYIPGAAAAYESRSNAVTIREAD